MRILMTIVSAASLAAGVAAREVPAAPAAAPPAEKKQCRSETITGTMMPQRSCHTRAEWQQIDAANHDNARRFEDRRTNTGYGNN